MKSSLASILIIAILGIVISIVFFVIPGVIGKSCSYVYAITIVVFIIAMSYSYHIIKRPQEQIFLKTPTLYVIYAILAIQTIFLFIIRIVHDMPNWVVVVIESLIIGIGAILTISLLVSSSYVTKVDIQTKEKTA